MKWRVWITTRRGFERFIDVQAEDYEQAKIEADKLCEQGDLVRYVSLNEDGRWDSETEKAKAGS